MAASAARWRRARCEPATRRLGDGGARARAPHPASCLGRRARVVLGTARSNGSSRASSSRASSSPTPIRSPAAATSTRCSSSCSRGSAAAVTPESLPRALEILEELTAELRRHGRRSAARSGLREAAAAAIAADLRRYLVHEAAGGGDWEPRHLELRFGFDGGRRARLPALTLGEAPSGVARVRGVIDRVDVDPSGRRAIVRDYKSGGTRAGVRRVRAGAATARSRSRCTCSPSASCSGSSRSRACTSRSSGRDLRARGVYLDGAPVGAGLVGTDERDAAELDG